jgi:hypothetical protein
VRRDASVYWVETTQEEVHFIDSIVSAYDGLANVRRDYRLRDGTIQFKVYVGPGMEEEFLALVDRLRGKAEIGTVVPGEDDEAPATE